MLYTFTNTPLTWIVFSVCDGGASSITLVMTFVQQSIPTDSDGT